MNLLKRPTKRDIRNFRHTRGRRSTLERAKGFEPSTPTLARLCSTPELHPHPEPAVGRCRLPLLCQMGLRNATGVAGADPIERPLSLRVASKSPLPLLQNTAMSATPADLFALLDRLGIKHTTASHPPLFTVEESRALRGKIPGGHTKNLFLRDKRGTFYPRGRARGRHDRVEEPSPQARRVGRFSFGSADASAADARRRTGLGDAVRRHQRQSRQRHGGARYRACWNTRCSTIIRW